jgi:hypothetical protein
MALANARKIIVNSNTYQWKVSPRGGLHLAVFHQPTGIKWVAWLENKTIVTPKVVRQFIEQCLVNQPIENDHEPSSSSCSASTNPNKIKKKNMYRKYTTCRS